MCGVLAQFSPRGVQEELFLDALKKLLHRGPERSSYWNGGRIALGHTLLSFSGSAGDLLPVSNEDGSVRASVNGEFYGYEKWRKRLESRGHVFHSASDSELLVHLYEEYGEECVKKLRGEFAFVLWDGKRERVFAARDRFGIKPLVYHVGGDGIILASEAKALLPLLPHGAGWSLRALGQVLTHQYTGLHETIFKGVYQIPPAHFLEFDKRGFKVQSYYDFPEENGEISSEEAVEVIREKLQDALRVRLHNAAAFSLSGGIDSSSLVAIASQMRGRDVPAFTISFDHSLYDEAPLVRDAADKIGADLQVVEVCREDLLDGLEDAVSAAEGIAINGQMVAKRKLAERIKEAGYKAVISAEGADEAFLGYAHLALDHGEAPPRGIQDGVMLPPEGGEHLPTAPPWLKGMPSFLKAKLAFCQKLRPLLQEDVLHLLEKDVLAKSLSPLQYDHSFPVQSAYLWTKMPLANYILRGLGDGTEMAYSIEGRVPYLDHDLFNFAWSLPLDLKLRNGETKWILRQALSGILPQELCQRPKQPLLAPPLIYDTASYLAVRERLLSFQCSLFNQDALEKWIQTIDPNDLKQAQAVDPVIHMVLSLALLEKNYNLEI